MTARIRDLGPEPPPEMLTLRLLEIQAQIQQWQGYYAENSGPEVQFGSSLWHDDQLTKPYHCSHIIQHYLYVGTDAMDALLDSTLIFADEERITLTTRPHGQIPLIRTALECACLAICLLGDHSQNARITARLRLAMEDVDRHAKTQKLATKDLQRIGASPGPTNGEIQERRGRNARAIVDIASALSIPKRAIATQIKMGEMVRQAGHLSGQGEAHTEFLWNLLAGASHGSHWASKSLLQWDVTEDDPDSETVTVTSTLPPWTLAYLIDETHVLQRHAWGRWCVRAAPPSA